MSDEIISMYELLDALEAVKPTRKSKRSLSKLLTAMPSISRMISIAQSVRSHRPCYPT